MKRIALMQGLLAVAITIGFFACIWLVMKHAVQENMKDTLLVLIGALGAAFGAVVNYYFGSSKGSADKTQLLGGKEP